MEYRSRSGPPRDNGGSGYGDRPPGRDSGGGYGGGGGFDDRPPRRDPGPGGGPWNSPPPEEAGWVEDRPRRKHETKKRKPADSSQRSRKRSFDDDYEDW